MSTPRKITKDDFEITGLDTKIIEPYIETFVKKEYKAKLSKDGSDTTALLHGDLDTSKKFPTLFDPKKDKKAITTELMSLLKKKDKPRLVYLQKDASTEVKDIEVKEADIASGIYAITRFANIINQLKEKKLDDLANLLITKQKEIVGFWEKNPNDDPAPKDINDLLSNISNSEDDNEFKNAIDEWIGIRPQSSVGIEKKDDVDSKILTQVRYHQLIVDFKARHPGPFGALEKVFEEKEIKGKLMERFKTNRLNPAEMDSLVETISIALKTKIADPVTGTPLADIQEAFKQGLEKLGVKDVDFTKIQSIKAETALIDPLITISAKEADEIIKAMEYAVQQDDGKPANFAGQKAELMKKPYSKAGIIDWAKSIAKIKEATYEKITNKMPAPVPDRIKYFQETQLMTEDEAKLVIDVIIYQSQQNGLKAKPSTEAEWKTLKTELQKKPFTLAGIVSAIESKDSLNGVTEASSTPLDANSVKGYFANIKGTALKKTELREKLTGLTKMSEEDAKEIIKVIVYQGIQSGDLKGPPTSEDEKKLIETLVKIEFTQKGIGTAFPATDDKGFFKTISGNQIRGYLKFDSITAAGDTNAAIRRHLKAQRCMTTDQANEVIKTIIYRAKQDPGIDASKLGEYSDAHWDTLRNKLKLNSCTEEDLEQVFQAAKTTSPPATPVKGKIFEEELFKATEAKRVEGLTPAKIKNYLELSKLGNVAKSAADLQKFFQDLQKTTDLQATTIADLFKDVNDNLSSKVTGFDSGEIKKELKKSPYTFETIIKVMQDKKLNDPAFINKLISHFSSQGPLSTAEREIFNGLQYHRYLNDPFMKRNPVLAAMFQQDVFKNRVLDHWNKNPKLAFFSLQELVSALINREMTLEKANKLFTRYFNHSIENEDYIKLRKELRSAATNSEWLSNIDNLELRQFLIEQGVSFTDQENAERACELLNKQFLANSTTLDPKLVINALFEEKQDTFTFSTALHQSTLDREEKLKDAIAKLDFDKMKKDQEKINKMYEVCLIPSSERKDQVDKSYDNVNQPTLTKPLTKEFRNVLLRRGLRFKNTIPLTDDKRLHDALNNFQKYEYHQFRDEVLAPLLEGGTTQAKSFLFEDFTNLQIYGVARTLNAPTIKLLLDRDQKSLVSRLQTTVQLVKDNKEIYSRLKWNTTLLEGVDIDAAKDTHKRLSSQLDTRQLELKQRKVELQQLKVLCDDYQECIAGYEFIKQGGDIVPKERGDAQQIIDKIIKKIQDNENEGKAVTDEAARAKEIYRLLCAEKIGFSAEEKVIGTAKSHVPKMISYDPQERITKELDNIEKALTKVTQAKKDCNEIQGFLDEAQEAKAKGDPEYAVYADEVSVPFKIDDDQKLQEVLKDMRSKYQNAPSKDATVHASGEYKGQVQKGKAVYIADGQQAVHYNRKKDTFFTVKRQNNEITTTIYLSSTLSTAADRKGEVKVAGKIDENTFLARETQDLMGGFTKAMNFWKNFKTRPMTYENARDYLLEKLPGNYDAETSGKILSGFERYERGTVNLKRLFGGDRDLLAKKFRDETTELHEDKQGKEVRIPKQAYFDLALEAIMTHLATTKPVPLIIDGDSQPLVEAMQIVCKLLDYRDYVDYSSYRYLEHTSSHEEAAVKAYPSLAEGQRMLAKAKTVQKDTDEETTQLSAYRPRFGGSNSLGG